MCGRFARTSSRDAIVATFDVRTIADAALPPSTNVAPGASVAAIVRREDGRRLGALRWGFVPHFARPPLRPQINARSETVASRPTFRDAFAHRRCLVVADGFYEWQRLEEGTKAPWLIRTHPPEPFAFAGIWDRFAPETGPAVATCAILTCPPAPRIASIHDRMPVILRPESIEAWLDPATPAAALAALLVPRPDAELTAHRVSTLVNSARHDGPELLVPLGESEDRGGS